MALSLPPNGDVGEDRYRPLAEINVTPMVDVMLVLLVIFMVTAPLLAVGVPVDLPKTSAAQLTQPKEPIVLSLDRDGGTFIGNERVEPGDFKDRLSQLAAEDPDRIVYVRGDRTISYDQLMTALGLVGAAGFTKVSLLAEGTSPK
jgi:biopolymer transport protein ExbD